MELITLAYPVPYAAQIASVELASIIFDGEMPAEQDPRWAESGARTPEEYAYWVERACGVACVKMCVEAAGGPVRPLVEWARMGVELGGYLILPGENGQLEEVGWIHSALADLCRAEGLSAEPRATSLDEITGLLRDAKMVIASASYQIGTSGPVTRKGGHLVVVTGAELENGRVTALRINNPSGRTPEMRIDARISAERFAAGFTGRVIAVGR